MEGPQSEACHCFFVADNVLNKPRLTLGRIMTSVHIKTEKTKGNRGTYHSIFFSLLPYQILEVSKIECFRLICTEHSLQNVTIHAEFYISFKKTVHSDGGRGRIFNCF